MTGAGCISSSSSSIQHKALAASSRRREKGYIEILKGPPGKPNLIIRHNLTTSSKASSFTFNGKSALGKDITQRIVEFNVQVGNLWFAPF